MWSIWKAALDKGSPHTPESAALFSGSLWEMLHGDSLGAVLTRSARWALLFREELLGAAMLHREALVYAYRLGLSPSVVETLDLGQSRPASSAPSRKGRGGRGRGRTILHGTLPTEALASQEGPIGPYVSRLRIPPELRSDGDPHYLWWAVIGEGPLTERAAALDALKRA